MVRLTDFNDTTDVSHAAIQWVIDVDGGNDTPKMTREKCEMTYHFASRSRIICARLIQEHRPDLLVDPDLLVVRKILAGVADAEKREGTGGLIMEGVYDDTIWVIGALAVYKKGKNDA